MPRWLIGLFLLMCSGLAAAQQAPAFTREQLDQMMAPIALYPDSLLSQVLMASTYPADVADAAKWSKGHADQKGDAAVKAVQDQPWDPSVQSLVAFPQVIQTMGDQPDWVQKLGDAFLASSKDVLDSAQRLRAKAQQNGSLKSNEQQTIQVEQEPQTQQTVIKIEPTNPQTVYVPAYNPAVVYGAWPYPASPPYYYPPYPAYYPGAALATGLAFGVGVAATAALWGNCNWGGGDININTSRYNSINSNRQISANQNKFQHNAANRRGVPYRDERSRQQYDRGVGGADQRQDFRGREGGREGARDGARDGGRDGGRDGARDSQRQQAQSALQQRGMDPGAGRENLRNDPGTRDRAQRAAEGTARDRAGGGAGAGDRGAGARPSTADRSAGNRGAGDSALRDAGGRDTQRQTDRGNASRQAAGGSGARGGQSPATGARQAGGGGGGARAGGGGGGGARAGGGGGGGGARAGGGGGGRAGGGGGGGRGGGGGGGRR